jgi:hypothetical protein
LVLPILALHEQVAYFWLLLMVLILRLIRVVVVSLSEWECIKTLWNWLKV